MSNSTATKRLALESFLAAVPGAEEAEVSAAGVVGNKRAERRDEEGYSVSALLVRDLVQLPYGEGEVCCEIREEASAGVPELHRVLVGGPAVAVVDGDVHLVPCELETAALDRSVSLEEDWSLVLLEFRKLEARS